MNDMRRAEHAARVDEKMSEYRLLMRDADCNGCLRRDNCDQRNNINLLKPTCHVVHQQFNP